MKAKLKSAKVHFRRYGQWSKTHCGKLAAKVQIVDSPLTPLTGEWRNNLCSTCAKKFSA